jgi:hypothetical protein
MDIQRKNVAIDLLQFVFDYDAEWFKFACAKTLKHVARPLDARGHNRGGKPLSNNMIWTL